MLTSLRDTALVARFEVLRAVRTWQALALASLYVVTTLGFTLMFVGVVWLIENEVANTLGVPGTRYPGAMTEKLLESGELQRMLTSMVGSAELVDHVLSYPLIAIFHLWIGVRTTPFLAAMTASESVSVDLRSRALRFEVVRTGRAELVVGRFVGQAILAAVAIAATVIGVWIVGMLVMVGNDPLWLMVSLIWLSVRIWAFSLPFIGLGLACSQITSSPAWARVMAISLTAGGWIAYTILWANSHRWVPWVWDLILPFFPFEWRDQLWSPGLGWLATVVVFAAMGLAVLAAGYLRFSRRDL